MMDINEFFVPIEHTEHPFWEGQKYNKYHDKLGRFTSGGGSSRGSGDGAKPKLSKTQRRKLQAELNYLTAPNRAFRLNDYQRERVRKIKEQLGG